MQKMKLLNPFQKNKSNNINPAKMAIITLEAIPPTPKSTKDIQMPIIRICPTKSINCSIPIIVKLI